MAVIKPKPISGFPEWLPAIRRVEQQWFDHIRRIFESYGFCSIETPSVEALEILAAKGEVDKEIYIIDRLHKDDGDKDREARLALHFDQTVPFARYVAQHFSDLTFPFKRYQMQRVWRGERPQAGRFREFYQCDIDVIAVDQLPLYFDAEMPAIMWAIMASLPGMEDEKFQIQISNRKILFAFLRDFSPAQITDITRVIDKIDKVDAATTLRHLTDIAGTEAERILQLATIRAHDSRELMEKTAALGIPSGGDSPDNGVQDLCFVLDNLAHLPKGAVIADLSIVRGLDYYTGTVYETRFLDDPAYGSICSGGRYDDLAGNYINKHLPGVGISIGFSRLFDRIRTKGKFTDTRTSPADILVTLWSDEQRPLASATAATLRQRGMKVELYHSPHKTGKQIDYALKKGIPFVWFCPDDQTPDHRVKNLSRNEQASAEPHAWSVPC